MTRASSEPQAGTAPASRIIAAESLSEVAQFDLTELATPELPAPRRLSSRDLSNETARAAYTLGRKRGWEQGVRAGSQQGYAQGAQALEAAESAQVAKVAAQLARLAEDFRGGLAALEGDVADDLVTLAIDIARQVLRRELASDPQALLPVAREALQCVAEGASQLHLHAHPDDAAMLAAHLEGAAAGQPQIVPDASLPVGSCRVEADTGVAEAGFAARWQAVMAALGRDAEPAP